MDPIHHPTIPEQEALKLIFDLWISQGLGTVKPGFAAKFFTVLSEQNAKVRVDVMGLLEYYSNFCESYKINYEMLRH